MRLNREQIAARLPHRGAMSLLDEVTDCTDLRIVCRSRSHRHPSNPMATPAGLPSAAGIEYAAQAMALHAALCLAGEPSAATGTREPAPAHSTAHSPAPDSATAPTGHGVLANIRSSVLHVRRLDTVSDDLVISASLVSGDASGALYQFTIEGDGQRLLDGRATVMFASAPAPSADGEPT